MKGLYIIYVGAFRLPNKDAAAARVLNNARAMKQLGHVVKFLSWGGEYRKEDLDVDGKYRIDGMEYVITNELDVEGSFGHRLLAMILRGRKSLELIKRELRKPDLIILYNADKGWTEKMLEYCKINDIKLADDITEWYDNNELHFWDIVPYYLNMIKTQKMVRNKIVISKYLNHYYKDSNNILLPPLCDQEDSKWAKTIVDDRIKPFDGITLFYAGNPAKKDCVHTVINVVNRLAYEGKNIRFIIVGINREKYIENYKSELETKCLHENVIFIGRVSQDIIPAYYKFADFMVLLREPSRKNMVGFPTKFAESVSAGIPVIANPTSDIGDYIEDYRTGFNVEYPTSDALESVLEDKVLKLDRESIARMKRNVDSMKSVFDYRTYSSFVCKFLNRLC